VEVAEVDATETVTLEPEDLVEAELEVTVTLQEHHLETQVRLELTEQAEAVEVEEHHTPTVIQEAVLQVVTADQV
jgi:hypothetical protein